MKFHELLNKRIQEKEAELNRVKQVASVLTEKEADYEIQPDSYQNGLRKLNRVNKDKLIASMMTELDVVFYNETM